MNLLQGRIVKMTLDTEHTVTVVAIKLSALLFRYVHSTCVFFHYICEYQQSTHTYALVVDFFYLIFIQDNPEGTRSVHDKHSGQLDG